MGLDQYLHRLDSDSPLGIMYWRDSAFLHDWISDNIHSYDPTSRTATLTRDDLERLRQAAAVASRMRDEQTSRQQEASSVAAGISAIIDRISEDESILYTERRTVIGLSDGSHSQRVPAKPLNF